MKTKLILTLGLLASISSFARDRYVSGYTRKDGTYVQGYYRTESNNTVNDNYSTRGNTNPYTGREGKRDQNPYQSGYTGLDSNSGSSTSWDD